MVNNVIGVVNYVIAASPSLLNFVIADNAVAATSGSNAWAVGSYAPPGARPRALILHWDGSTWTQVPAPNPSGRYRSLHLYGVAAISASRAWAVGGYGVRYPVSSRGPTRALVERWDGTKWTIVRVPSKAGSDAGISLSGVAAVSPSDVMAAGVWNCQGLYVPAAERAVRGIWRLVATPSAVGNPCV